MSGGRPPLIRWNPAADQLLRDTIDHPTVGDIIEQLIPLLGRRISSSEVYTRLRTMGLKRRNSTVRRLTWNTPEVLAWLEPRWKAGAPTEDLRDGVTQITGMTPGLHTVAEVCYRNWGARSQFTGTNIRRGLVATATRHRRCSLCREWFDLPQYVFRCDACRRTTAGEADVGGYRTAGLRVA